MEDEKIIAICKDDPSLNVYRDVSELPSHIMDEICHFFKVYKQLEGKKTFVSEVKGREEAIKIIEKSIHSFDKLIENK